jgi:hypothetical protein
MTGVFYLSLTEVTQKENLISFKQDNLILVNNNLENKITIQNKEILINNPTENCREESSQFKYIQDLVAKSMLAFLAGCILSEKKFFRFGII